MPLAAAALGAGPAPPPSHGVVAAEQQDDADRQADDDGRGERRPASRASCAANGVVHCDYGPPIRVTTQLPAAF